MATANREMLERLTESVSKTGVEQRYRGANRPVSPPLFKHLPRIESVTLSTLGSGLKRTA
ncbi:hypothetical protein DMB84_018375 [Pectobacterium aquaticum]|uniref:Uncharacterized protein n=1 Tax=Pectobacterium aquaticum TaxID=2204145 RepID=A0AA93ALL5_9GAMM|nr:hypothetical protein DMB84_018375 [Pectobacterium aquaticum]